MQVMQKSKWWLTLGVIGCLSAPFVHATDPATDDSVTVADDTQTPDQVAGALPNAAPNAAFGQSVAAQARNKGDLTGREFGQSIADQVRQDATNEHASAAAGNPNNSGRH